RGVELLERTGPLAGGKERAAPLVEDRRLVQQQGVPAAGLEGAREMRFRLGEAPLGGCQAAGGKVHGTCTPAPVLPLTEDLAASSNVPRGLLQPARLDAGQGHPCAGEGEDGRAYFGRERHRFAGSREGLGGVARAVVEARRVHQEGELEQPVSRRPVDRPGPGLARLGAVPVPLTVVEYA